MKWFGLCMFVIAFLAATNTRAFDPLFDARIDYAVGTWPASVSAADLDGDEDNDLAAANSGSADVSILLNNGNGTFQAIVNYDVGGGPISIFASDIDGDGDNDLAVANVGSRSISIMLNGGDGTFQAAVDYGVGVSPHSVFGCDLDGDGDDDLAAANWNSCNVSILLNNGDGTFQTAVDYGVGSYPYSVFASDIDGDGNNDLAVANTYSNNICILLNRTIVSAIGEEPGTGPLTKFRFSSQNYPNPFNSQTTIAYSISQRSEVKIDIFDVLGRRIACFSEGKMEPGSHQITWDAKGAPSGIYFYKLRAGDFRETKRMLLLK